MDLQVISQAVNEHLGQVGNSLESHDQRLARWGKITSLSGVSILCLLALVAFICLTMSLLFGMNFGSFGFAFFAPLVVTVSLFLVFTGAGLMSYPALKKELRSPKRKKLPRSLNTAELASAGSPEGLSSITEHTTKLLETDHAELSHGREK
jgi:hypothetical protein